MFYFLINSLSIDLEWGIKWKTDNRYSLYQINYTGNTYNVTCIVFLFKMWYQKVIINTSK